MDAKAMLLKAEELILRAWQSALDKAAKEPDALGRLTWESVASAHKLDADVCRLLRESGLPADTDQSTTA